MNAPLLDVFQILFFHQSNFSVPHLRQFVTTTLNVGCSRVEFLFYPDAVAVFAIPSASASLLTFSIRIADYRRRFQVTSMAQMCNELGPLFSTAVELRLVYRSDVPAPWPWHNKMVPVQWRLLLETFRNVETLRVYDGLVGTLFHGLTRDGGSPSEILPKLKSLVCSKRSRNDETLTRFVYDRKVAGLPINVVVGIHQATNVDYSFRKAIGMGYISHNPARLRLA
jgi:hypothetical protein